MMDPQRARKLEQWFAASFKSMPGGYEGVCELPDCPITARKLGEAARGLARLSLGEAVYLASMARRPDMLRALADQVDGGESAAQALERLSRNGMYQAAHMAEHVDLAEQDGIYTAAEVQDAIQKSSELVRAAHEIHDAALKLTPGPVAVATNSVRTAAE